MLPKIEFTRSWIYDTRLARNKKSKMPKEKVLIDNTRKIEALWRKHEKAVLTEISKVLNIPWREKQINIYMSWGVGWFSKPLTLSTKGPLDKKHTKWLLDTLVHELIHRIWSENKSYDMLRPRWERLMKKYNKETTNARIHIPVHAVHKHIYLNLFSEKDLRDEIKDMRKAKDYARSWEVVERDGYENIIRSLNPKYKAKK